MVTSSPAPAKDWGYYGCSRDRPRHYRCRKCGKEVFGRVPMVCTCKGRSWERLNAMSKKPFRSKPET